MVYLLKRLYLADLGMARRLLTRANYCRDGTCDRPAAEGYKSRRVGPDADARVRDLGPTSGRGNATGASR